MGEENFVNNLRRKRDRRRMGKGTKKELYEQFNEPNIYEIEHAQ